MNINYLELVGYLASVLVLVSILMSSLVKLRIFNLIGALLFSAYGFLIGSFPVAIVNACIAVANIYYLIRMTNLKDSFSLIELKEDSNYLKKFISFYELDIEKYYADFKFEQKDYPYTFLLLRNMSVVGVLLCKRYNGDSLLIDIDYVTPENRDLKIGEHVYTNETHVFKKKGFDHLLMFPPTKDFEKYANLMGFEQQNENNLYKLDI